MGRIRSTVIVGRVTIAVALVAALLATAPAWSGATPSCGITWGSLRKAGGVQTTAPVVDLRAGQHLCYDRLVVDLAGTPPPGYVVEYVSQFRANATGTPIPLRGGAFLQISVFAPSVDAAGQPTYPPNRSEAVSVGGFRTFRQVHFDTDFEALTNVGLGVRARLPFRVFMLPGPGSGSRLVIDVAHRW